MIGLLILAQLGAAQHVIVAPPVSLDSAHHAAERFVRTWRYYWESSEVLRNHDDPFYEQPESARGWMISSRDSKDRTPVRYQVRKDSIEIRKEYATIAGPRDGDRTAHIHCHQESARDVNGLLDEYKKVLTVSSDQLIPGSNGWAVCPSW